MATSKRSLSCCRSFMTNCAESHTSICIASTPTQKHQSLLALDEALHELEKIGPQQSRIIELRYFGGLTIEETATAMDISPATVKREWAMARAWLYKALTTAPVN